MQNKYFGDVGDFGKYGLLRKLCSGNPGLELGIVWYLVPNESKTNDGKFIGYLERSSRNLARFRACDPELYDILEEAVTTGNRRVSTVSEYSLFPNGTAYYEVPLHFGGLTPADHPGRRSLRHQWVQGALAATSRCSVIFLDPDNGLEVTTKDYQNKGPKYVFYRELAPYVERGQSLIVYHHTNRQGTARQQVQYRFEQISKQFVNIAAPFGLLYHRGTSRAFLFIPARQHGTYLRERVAMFLEDGWSEHFDMVESPH